MRHLFAILFFVATFTFVASCSPAKTTANDQTSSPQTDSAAAGTASADPELEAAVKSMGLIYLADKPPAIEFALDKLGGGKVKLSDLKGKVVILNFWATWCGPCKIEMPSLQSLYDQIKNSNIVILAVDSQETGDVADAFVKEFKYTFPVLLDGNGNVTSQYSVQGIPTTYIIDKDGHVVAGKTGTHDWSNPAIKKGLDLLLSRT